MCPVSHMGKDGVGVLKLAQSFPADGSDRSDPSDG